MFGWIKRLRLKDLFDGEWYLRRYPDVAAAGVPPLGHYLANGAREGRQPHPLFDPSWYVECCPAVERPAAMENPLRHYLEQGAKQGFPPHPLFDPQWYLSQCPVREQKAAKPNPLLHYLAIGAAEGLSPHPIFDPGWYLRHCPEAECAAAHRNPLLHYLENGGRCSPHEFFDAAWYVVRYPDVGSSGIAPLLHYARIGAHEGRSPHPFFDPAWYLDQCLPEERNSATENALRHYIEHGARQGLGTHPLFDPAWYLRQLGDEERPEAAANPLGHYQEHGTKKGRSPHPFFDPAWYLQNCPSDHAAAKIDPLRHYLEHGQGRSPHFFFDAAWYAQRYPDISAGGQPLLCHYVRCGIREGRQPHPLFDPGWYLEQCSPEERRLAADNPLRHFIKQGQQHSPHPLFDPGWYLDHLTDEMRSIAALHPLRHHLLAGSRQTPHPLFDPTYYLEEYPEVGEPPLLHYCRDGWQTGHNPNPAFDSAFYLDLYPDVAQARLNPLAHYVSSGGCEGRLPHPWFDPVFYLSQRPDAGSLSAVLAHYLHVSGPDGALCHPCYRGLHISVWPETEDPAESCPRSLPSYVVILALDGPTGNLPLLASSLEEQQSKEAELWLLGSQAALAAADAAGLHGRTWSVEPESAMASALNEVLAQVHTETAVLVRPYHVIARGGLDRLLSCFADNPKCAAAYADHADVDVRGFICRLARKPRFDLEFHRTTHYVGQLLAIRPKSVLELGGFDPAFPQVREAEILLRLAEKKSGVEHATALVYFSVGDEGNPRPERFLTESASRQLIEAVEAHLRRTDAPLQVLPGLYESEPLQLIPAPTKTPPSLSVVLTGEISVEVLRSLAASLPSDVEIFIYTSNLTLPPGLSGARLTHLPVLPRPRFLNLAAKSATGDFLLLLDGVQSVQPGHWLSLLMAYAGQKDVAAVGPLVLEPDESVAHAGYQWKDPTGYPGHGKFPDGLRTAREVMGLSGTVMLVRRKAILEVGGVVEDYDALYDLDCCLRLGRAGWRCVLVPEAKLIDLTHFAPSSLWDKALLIDTWRGTIKNVSCNLAS